MSLVQVQSPAPSLLLQLIKLDCFIGQVITDEGKNSQSVTISGDLSERAVLDRADTHIT